MIKRGHLNVPVIGVAKQGWNLDQFRARARDSLEKHGGVDEAAFAKLADAAALRRRRLRRPGDVHARCARELGDAQHPAHYLAIPPVLFGAVVEQLAKADCAKGARVIVEKPFGRDLASARKLNAILLSAFRRGAHLPHRSLPRQAAGAEHALLPLRQCVSSSRSGTATTSRACRSRWPRTSASRGAASSTTRPARFATSCRTTCSRSCAISRWSRRCAPTASRCATRRSRCSRRSRPLEPDDLVRGQFRGYRKEPGVAPDSTIETFAAVQLHVDSWRWQGVPFYIRAGKNLPVTCTEVMVRLRRPPTMFPNCTRAAQLPALPHQPRRRDRARHDGDGRRRARCVGAARSSLLASHHPTRRRDGRLRARAGRRDGRRRDAVRARGLRRGGVADRRSGARCAARRSTPYEPGQWGPRRRQALAPPGGWDDPAVNEPSEF